jgi:hypothetical protein
MADPNLTSSAPAMMAVATTSLSPNLDTDPDTPLNQQPPFRPRAPPTPHLGAGQDLFGDAPASLHMMPTSSVPPTTAPASTHPNPASPTLSIRDINIDTYINFKVQTYGANISKWRQTFTYISHHVPGPRSCHGGRCPGRALRRMAR